MLKIDPLLLEQAVKTLKIDVPVAACHLDGERLLLALYGGREAVYPLKLADMRSLAATNDIAGCAGMGKAELLAALNECEE